MAIKFACDRHAIFDASSQNFEETELLWGVSEALIYSCKHSKSLPHGLTLMEEINHAGKNESD